MGIFLGWIIQKRWLTLATAVLNLAAVFTLPRLPTPFSYLVLVAPVIFIVALFYEGGAMFPLRLSPRVRLTWALWMGICVLVLMSGIVLSGTNSFVLIATIAAFGVLAMSGALWVAFIHARNLRQEQVGRSAGGHPTD